MDWMSIPNSENEMRNWLELPADVVSMILMKLGAIEILNNAQNVCSLWRKICKDPLMWRVIDMHNLGDLHDKYDLKKMCVDAIDRSCGGLVDISLEYFGTDDLLLYITKSSKQIKRLRLVCCYDISDKGLVTAVSELPLLEHLETYLTYYTTNTLESIGRCCPLLQSLKYNSESSRNPCYQCDTEAIAIAENMPNLRHLQIIGNLLTNKGLKAILDGCSDLESLDLRVCFNLNLKGRLGSKCAGRIKNLLLPHDPLDGYEYNAIIDDHNSFPQNIDDDDSLDEDYLSGYSDTDFMTDDDDYEFSGGSDFSNSSRNPKFAKEKRNWLELPAEVMSMILQKLCTVDILNNAQNVCSLWRKICKDSSMWRVIDMYNLGDLHDMEYSLEVMCMHAIDRSCGGLIDINIEYFGNDELLQYITQSSNQLKRLRIAICYDISQKGLIKTVSKLPLLENLEIHLTDLSPKTLEAVGRCCPLLKSFKFNCQTFRITRYQCDKEALAIAKNMPNLRHLQLIGNVLTNNGLQAILDGCPDLESLDLRACFNLNLEGPLGSKCAERIKNLQLPHDSLRGYEFMVFLEGSDPRGDYSDISYDDDDDDYY